MADSQAVIVPTALALEKGLEVAGSDAELIAYLSESYRAPLAKAHLLEDFKPLLTSVNELAEQAKYVETISVNVWDGETTGISEKSAMAHDYQRYLASKKFEEVEQQLVNEHATQVTTYYNITPESQYVRGYMIEGKAAEPSAAPEQQPD